MTASWRERAHGLWDELAGFAASEMNASRLHLLKTVSGWIGADNAAWIGTVRMLQGTAARKDAMRGWRTRTIVFLHPPEAREMALARRALGDCADEPGMTSIATAAGAGHFRVHQLRDGFVDFSAFQHTTHYDAYYRQLGVTDRLWVGTPVSLEAESLFVFDKRGSGKTFTTRQAQEAGYVMRGLTWYQRQLLCGHGLMAAQSPLTPMERRVVQLLLTEKSEKEIAAELGQSPLTTHGHVKGIFRKFGVNGRAGLMAVWLSRR